MYTFHSQREAAAAWAESGLFNKGSAETHIRRFLRLAANPGGDVAVKTAAERSRGHPNW